MYGNMESYVYVIVVTIVLLFVVIAIFLPGTSIYTLVNGSDFPTNTNLSITNTSGRDFRQITVWDCSGTMWSMASMDASGSYIFHNGDTMVLPMTSASSLYLWFSEVDGSGNYPYLEMVGNVNQKVRFFYAPNELQCFTLQTTSSPVTMTSINYLYTTLATIPHPVNAPIGTRIQNGATFPTQVYLYNSNNDSDAFIAGYSSTGCWLDASGNMSPHMNALTTTFFQIDPSSSSTLIHLGTIPDQGHVTFFHELVQTTIATLSVTVLYNQQGKLVQLTGIQPVSFLDIYVPNGMSAPSVERPPRTSLPMNKGGLPFRKYLQ